MRRILIASSALILSSFVAFAPAAMAQRAANGGGQSAPVATPRIASAPQVGAPTVHVQPQIPHAPAMSRVPAGTNAPARSSVHAVHQGGTTGQTITRTSGAAIGVHRVTPATIQPHRLNVMSGLGRLPLSSTDFVGSPGLGFDYPHVAAMSGANSLTNGRLRDRVDGRVPLGFSGFLLSPEVVVVAGQPGEAEPSEENAEASAERENTAERENIQDQFAPVSLGPAAPIHDAAEYVFVRRDGTLVFAVGYTWDHGTLRYVTRDGYRRSISGDALDLDATQQFNEHRGLNFRTPA